MLGRRRWGAGLDRGAPLVDRLDREAPVAADTERGQLIFLEHPVNGGRMHAQVGRHFLNRENLALHFVESIHLDTSLVGSPSLLVIGQARDVQARRTLPST